MMSAEQLRTYFSAVLTAMGLTPTEWRLAFFSQWARFEGTGAAWNPLATTQPGGEAPGNPYWNTFGDAGQYHVRNYASASDGVSATVATLQNGHYVDVLRAVEAESIADPIAVAGNIRTWGTTGFADRVEAGWVPSVKAAIPAAAPVPSLEERMAAQERELVALRSYVDAINSAVLARFNALGDAVGQLTEGAVLAHSAALAAADPSKVPGA